MAPLWIINAVAWGRKIKPLLLPIGLTLLALAYSAALLWLGNQYGQLKAGAECSDTLRLIREASEADRADRQAAADEIDAANVRRIDVLRDAISPLAQSLANETQKPDYSCRPTPNGLRLLNAGRAAANKAASQRDD